MSRVLDWIKSNLVIVILAVIMVAVMILAPIFSSSRNAAIRAEAETRASTLR